MTRMVADLGNSRLKWARLDDAGRLGTVVALPVDDPAAWAEAWAREGNQVEGGDLPSPSSWAVATVNPPLAERFGAFLSELGGSASWYRSAADVPVPHALKTPETAGADRALAVVGALALRPPGCGVRVVQCGTAVTLEWVEADGVWRGGAITAGLGLLSRALHLGTAQLPLINLGASSPPAWGASTIPALEAGVFWGVVGAVRELLARQADPDQPTPWVVWTGGDAPLLAAAVGGTGAQVVPDLVLRGLARVAFGGGI